MSGLGEAIKSTASKLLCLVAGGETFADNYFDRTRDRGGNSIEAEARNASRAYVQAVLGCPPSQDVPPGYQPGGTGFTPGQCNTRYRVSYTVNFSDNNGPQVEDVVRGSLPGPIEPLQLGPIPDRDADFFVYGQRADGTFRIYSGYGTTNNPASGGVLSNVSITRVDGEPDECGDFDGDPRYTGPLTVINNEGDEVTYEGNIVLAPPRIGPGGGLTIPVAWISPEFSFDGTLDFSPDLDLKLNVGNDGETAARPINSNPGGSGPDAPNPPPSDYAPIIGVFVVSERATDVQTTTEYGDGESPTLFEPRCATVLFAIRGGGRVGWSKPYSVQSLSQYIPWQGELEAYDVRVIEANGFSSQAFPVALDIEPEN